MSQEQWRKLIEFNATVLEQASDTIDHCVEFAVPFSHHVGPHLRHVIEHYEALLKGLRSIHVEYDVRDRNRQIERDPALARSRIDGLIDEVRSMAGLSPDQGVRVVFEGGLQGESNFDASSTLSRELLFLTHHTVHHFALLKSALADMGVPLQANFGLAPATVKHANGAVN